MWCLLYSRNEDMMVKAKIQSNSSTVSKEEYKKSMNWLSNVSNTANISEHYPPAANIIPHQVKV